MSDEFLSGLLFRMNDATKPIDAADRNLIIRALSNATHETDARPVAITEQQILDMSFDQLRDAVRAACDAPPIRGSESLAIQELENIANAKRFDHMYFEDDTSFADWVQSRVRACLATGAKP